MARLFALHDLYVVGVLIYLLLALTTRDRFWPVMALGYLAHLLLIVAFLALPLSLILRRWGSVAIQGTCLLAFILLFGDTVVGRGPIRAEPGAPALTVATFNLGDGLVEVDELEDFLRESRADIVGLEEVTPSAALAAELVRDLYPFQEVRAGGNTGKAILSKFRIQEVQWLEFHPERPDLMAFIDFDGTEIAVLVVHPPPPAAQLTGIKPREYTSRQWDLVIDLIENSDGPMIVMGDMNIAEMHEPYDRLENAGLQDLYREVGRGPGFTNPARFPRIGDRDTPLDWLPVVPFVRIDYIWASEEWQPVDARVDDARGSDHRPVVATVALRAER